MVWRLNFRKNLAGNHGIFFESLVTIHGFFLGPQVSSLQIGLSDFFTRFKKVVPGFETRRLEACGP